jgi:hypothetical protein
MDEPTDQRAINDAQWHDPANWAGVRLFQAYFSKRDSRIFVPGLWNSRFSPATLNYGHRYGFLVQSLLLGFILAVWLWLVVAR